MTRQQIGTVSSRKLRLRYWKGAGEDLLVLGYVVEVPHKKGCLRWYRIFRTLPTKEELNVALLDYYTRPISEWLEVVEAELNHLKEEMEEWRSNMQDGGLDSTGKYQQVEEAEDGLNAALDWFDPGLAARNVNLSGITVAVHPRDLFVTCNHHAKKERSGRIWRAKEVCSILDAIARAVRAVKSPDKQVHEFSDLIQRVSHEVEDVEFPRAFD